jgi:hypothetical protein
LAGSVDIPLIKNDNPKKQATASGRLNGRHRHSHPAVDGAFAAMGFTMGERLAARWLTQSFQVLAAVQRLPPICDLANLAAHP